MSLMVLSPLSHGFLESPTVLPKGVNSVSLITGRIDGLTHQFNSQGQLTSLKDAKSIELSSEILTAMNPQFETLQATLNQFGPYQFGEKLHLGKIFIDINPNVSYYAPVYARGITDKWTLAFTSPFMQFDYKINLDHVGSNINDIRGQLYGLSNELDAAFDQLDVDGIETINQHFNEKKLAPLKSYKKSIWGDFKITSLYKFYSDEKSQYTSKTLITLPTGPKDNPDDLTDPEGFAETSIEEKFIFSKKSESLYEFVGAVGYKLIFPTKKAVRIPADESDFLPGPETKQVLTVLGGEQLTLNLSIAKKISNKFSLGFGYEYINKRKDRHTNGPISDYSFLTEGTNRESSGVDMEISYSTVEAYFKKQALLPMTVWFSASNVITGINTAKNINYSLWLMMFF